MKLLRTIIVCYLCMLSLTGCSSAPVADDVAQREANEIVAVLSKHKIQAQLVKARGGKGRYSVVVQEGDFPSAAEVLSRLGLPAEKKPSFQELTGSNGIIPPSREVEALRLDRAVAAELEDLFRARSDVAAATIVVRMHSRESNERPTVTVVVQRASGAQLDTAEIREIAKRAVPGIQNDDVYVSVAGPVDFAGEHTDSSAATAPFLGVWRVHPEDHSGLVSLVVALVVVSGVLAGFAGYIVGQFNWLNRQGSLGSSRPSKQGMRGAAGTVQDQSQMQGGVSSKQGSDSEGGI